MQIINKIILILFFIIVLNCNASAHDIKGNVNILSKSGVTNFGSKIDIYLTTRKVYIPILPTKIKQNTINYNKSLINSLCIAWKSILLEMNTNDYVRQYTKTNNGGMFIFEDVTPGNYFIVVTFPSTIEKHKVLWQVPVFVKDKDLEVKLSNQNMALPAYYER